MQAVIIGGGKGCKALIQLAAGTFLKEFSLDIKCVMDVNDEAPGMIFAREKRIPTTTDMQQVLSIPGIEGVVELTGRDDVLEKLYQILPHGVKVIDHTFAHIFWDLLNAQAEQKQRLREITELDRRIAKERRFLQSVFDSTPDMLAVLDNRKRIFKVNTRFEQFLGLPASDIIGKSCEEVFTRMDLGCDCKNGACEFDSWPDDGEPHMVVRQTPPPNETQWEFTQTPILRRDGTVDARLYTWHRITEEVILRRKVRSADEQLKSLIYSAQDMISIKSLDGRYLIVNPITAQSFGLKPEDFIGKTAEEVLPEKLAKTITLHDQEVMRKKRHLNYEEVIPVNGHDRYFNTVRFPLTDYKGTIIGTCTIARDVTSEKELQDQLVQSTKLAAVGKLAAGVAHEINNPLTGILAYAEDVLDEVEDNSDLHDDMQVIIRETIRCRDIVRNLLDFARLDTPKFEKSTLRDLISSCLTLVERLADFKDVSIKKMFSDKIITINCDQKQVEQVILNFLMNAGDAMGGKGNIILRTELDENTNRCVISVEDDGPGIPENLIDKIFEPFFSTKGTNGLGLAVSWGIVERHKGSIEVDTAENGGAIFKIVLPVS